MSLLFLSSIHEYVSRSEFVALLQLSATGGRRATPVHTPSGFVPREETLFPPPGLCRAILPALFPAWAVSRCTIHQLMSTYFDSSLWEMKSSHTLGENASHYPATNLLLRERARSHLCTALRTVPESSTSNELPLG